jgi:hypothetical protein
MGENTMATPAVGVEYTGRNSIDISKLMQGARLLSMSFSMGIGNLRQISVKAETTADPTQIRNQKKLIDSPELDEIRSQDAKCRRHVEIKASRYTGQEGVLIVADAMIPQIDRMLVAYETLRRPALVAKFMAKYRAEYADDFKQTRLALGDVFNIKDYPHPDVVEAGFVFNYHYMDIQTTGKISIADPLIREREERKSMAIVRQAAEDMRAAMRLAGAQMVEALFGILKPEDGTVKKMHACHLTNLQEYLENYNLKDVTDDAEYQTHVNTLRSILGGVSIEKLRESSSLKSKVAEELNAVRGNLKSLVQESGRKFRV